MHNTSIRGHIDHEASLTFVHCYLHVMYTGENDLTLILFSDEPWFHLNGYINSKIYRHGSAENPTLSYEVLLQIVRLVCGVP